MSEPRLVTSDLLQGSLLVTPLFLYINNAFDVIRNGAPFLATEDIKVFCTLRPEASKSTIIMESQDVASLNSHTNGWVMK